MINEKIKQLFKQIIINCGKATAAFFIGYCIKVLINYSYFSITGLKINLDTAQYIFGLIVGLICANLLKECKKCKECEEYENQIEEYKRKSERYNEELRIYIIFIHHVEHQLFEWCRFRNLEFEPEELKKMLKETSDRLGQKLNRLNELEKQLENKTECKEYKNSIGEYNNQSEKFNKDVEEYAKKTKYNNLKRNYKKLRKTYIKLFDLHHSAKEKSDKILLNYLTLEREHKKLEMEHKTLTVQNYALNEMLHENKLFKKIEEYEMLLQIFLKLDFEKLLFLINSSDTYKNNIIPILINKIKYGKKDLGNQKEESEENIKKNILNFHIMECNQYISRCINALPKKKSTEM